MSTGLPPTFNPTAAAEVARRRRVFDPALKQYGSAVRPTDPAFARPDDAARWQAARRQATDHVLRAAAESAWGDHLVLRGSRLLRAWLGDAAREPGDLDWVTRPVTARPTDGWSARLLAMLTAEVATRHGPPWVTFLTEAVATTDIWTYERAAGRRVVFPWQTPGLPGGSVQVDVVFGEELPDEPVRVPVPAADGGCVTTWAAGPAQSLAWKLLWLDTDMYPQGKDLYDAVLLAEHTRLPRTVLARTFALDNRAVMPASAEELVGRWRVDWDNFLLEYPWVTGTQAEWRGRLVRALEPAFAADPGLDPATERPAWVSADVLALARGIAEGGAFARLPILADALDEAGCDEPDVVAHCRAAGPHGGACWVIDRILGPPRGDMGN